MGFEPIYLLRDRQATTPSSLMGLAKLVTRVGFEPTTFAPQTRHSPRLS